MGHITGLALAVSLAMAAPAFAQAPDPRLAAAQSVFDALAEAERKAIQADLIWTGDFEGTGAGGFGPMTFRAINAFKARVTRGEANGVLSAPERKLLADAAKAGRERVGFTQLQDERSGARIGIPQKLLVKRDVNPMGGSRWQSADQKVTLDTRVPPKTDTLPALFEKATTGNVPGRRITYKLLRPDFYVISGETATGKFFSRMASGAEGLRGFSIGYDKALAATVDPLVIAIANAFEPFPGAAPATTVAARPATSATPAAAEPAPLRGRFGVGYAIAPGLVLTAKAAVEGCRALKAGDRPAQAKSSDLGSGLALLAVEGLAGQPLKLAAADPTMGDEMLVLAFGDGAQRMPAVLPGRVTGTAKLMVMTPLQPGGAGAPAFDASGHLAGVATADPAARYLVAGVAPQRSHGFAGREAVSAFLKQAGIQAEAAPTGARMSAGAIAAQAGARLVSVACEN